MAATRPVKRFRFADDVVGEGVTAAPPAPRRPNEDPRIIAYKKARTDQFSEWRRGNYDWEESDRQAQIKAVVHPKPGAWDPWDLSEPTDDQANDVRANRRMYRRTDPDEADEEVVRRRVAVVEEASTDLLQNFQPVGFKSLRTLGVSGRAAIFKCSMVDRDNKRHSVAVKVNARQGMSGEVRILKVRHSLPLFYACVPGLIFHADNRSD